MSTENGPAKPWIALSGDDDGKHYILMPQSEARDNFDYDMQMIIETGNETGIHCPRLK